MGYFIYAAYSVFIKKKDFFWSVIALLISGFLLLNLKPYILYCLVAVFFLWIFYRFRDSIGDRTLRNVSTILFTSLAILVGFLATQGLGSTDSGSQFAADQLLTTVQHQQTIFQNNKGEAEGAISNFTVGGGDVSKSIGSLVLLFPVGIVNTFFRPFIWDVHSPMMIFSFFESLCFLTITILCLIRVGIKKTFGIIFTDPVIAFCFVFAVVFGGVIGVTTTNFGALVRYKIPCITFYAMAFFLVMDKSGKFSPKYVFSKKLF